MLRLGRKVLAENPQKDAFEFGVVVITEVGKERGNNLELREVRKNTLETNQKNDLFNTALKMERHPATVANFPFVRIITDEQRPSSWGADARDMAEIIHIREKSDFLLSNLSFFFLPAGVSILNYVDVLRSTAVRLVLVCLISTVVTFGVTTGAATLVLRLLRKGGRR